MSIDAAEVDVLVVGAGPVGLMAASELRRHDLKVRLIDKLAEPSSRSKALAVWARTLEIFEAKGIANEALQRGNRMHAANIYCEQRKLVHMSLDGLDSKYQFALILPQYETERLLTEHLGSLGCTVERPVELLGFEQEASGVIARLRLADGSEQSQRARWLLGCDGAHSTVRHALQAPFDGVSEKIDFALADVVVEGPLSRDEVHLFWHKDGVLALFPLDDKRVRVIVDRGNLTDESCDPTLEEMQRYVDERGPGGQQLSDPRWLACFKVNERQVQSYRHGNVFLAGDAAHVHSPAGGQGMNLGLQDAWNLAWKMALVAHGQAAPSLLDTYSPERHAIGREIIRGASFATRVATLRNPLAQSMRNGIASLLASQEFVLNKMRATISELELYYAKSPLSVEHRGREAEFWKLDRGVRPGEKAPDVQLGQRWLQQDWDGCRFHLLLLEGPSPPRALMDEMKHVLEAANMPHIVPHWIGLSAYGPPDVPYLADSDGEVHRRFGAGRACAYLIRPDGYVGYRGMPPDAESLRQYLRSIFIAVPAQI